ncbi:MAG: hypothetical protein AB1405_16275 [Bdellovibrionota bacterium]
MEKLLRFIDSRPGVAIFTALLMLLATYARDFVDSRLDTRMSPVVTELTAIKEEIVRMREEQKSILKLVEIQERRIARLEEKR